MPNSLVDGLLRWDGRIYADIAVHGYDAGNTAFFPLYPLLTKALYAITGNVYVAGLIISNTAFLVFLAYMYALALREGNSVSASRTIFFLAIAPGSVIFSAMYSESLFGALAVATLYYARQGQWTRTAIVGCLAAVTRNTGVILAAAVVVEGLLQAGNGWPYPHGVSSVRERVRYIMGLVSRARHALITAVWISCGLGAYILFLTITFHDPLAILHSETRWHDSLSLTNLTHLVWGQHVTLVMGIDIGVTLVFLPLVIGVCMRMRPSYGVYTLAAFLLTLDTRGVNSMTRYSLMLIPCYLLLGRVVRQPILNRLLPLILVPLMLFLTIVFAHWGDVS